jgi:lysophospholipase L1-like esterase
MSWSLLLDDPMTRADSGFGSPGNGWVDVGGDTAGISSNMLVFNTGLGGNVWASFPVARPSGETGQNQRMIMVTGPLLGGGYSPIIRLRDTGPSDTSTWYFGVVDSGSLYCGYSVGSGINFGTPVGGICSPGTAYILDFQAVSTDGGHTDLTLSVYAATNFIDASTGNILVSSGGSAATPLGVVTRTADTTSALQTSNGRFAVAPYINDTAADRILTYNQPTSSLTLTPSAVDAGSTANAITLTGVGSSWTPGTPGSPTFTVSGGTKNSQSVASTTSASMSYDAPASAGSVTVTDPSTGDTAVLTVNAAGSPVAGTASWSSSSDTQITVALAGSTGSIQWHASPSSGFTPGPGTAISGATSPTYAHTPGTGAGVPVFYKAVVTLDGSSATSNQVAASLRGPEIRIARIGDSITAGTAPAEAEAALSKMGPLRHVSSYTNGLSGSFTAHWRTDYPGGHFSAGNLQAVIAAALGGGYTHVSIMLGSNDCRNNNVSGGGDDQPAGYVSAATYGSNMANICGYIVGQGLKVILHYPPCSVVNSDGFTHTETSVDMLRQYQGQLDALVDGEHVLRGDTQAFNYFAEHPEELTDGLHPDPSSGSKSLGLLWARAEDRIFNPPAAPAVRPAPRHAISRSR